MSESGGKLSDCFPACNLVELTKVLYSLPDDWPFGRI